MSELRVPVKINYVLCKNMNTSSTYIKEVIQYAQQHQFVQLRFLETVVNSTNNQKGRMSRFVFTQEDFENVLARLGHGESVRNKVSDTRSSCVYNIDGCNIKFIKFFCDNDCEDCPEDKTSLWLTSTGCIKKCCYRSSFLFINNWQYNRIAQQLESFV